MLWARLTAEGTEYFWIDTALSAAQLGFENFEFEKLQSSRSQKSRPIQSWFALLKEITELPLVAELLTLFGDGFLPISVAAPLGEKERAAAFAAPHPLVWIVLYAPRLCYDHAPRPEKIFGYDCTTNNSYMLRVVHRGNMDDQSYWHAGMVGYVQHGQLTLLNQAFL
jgi:hypothetical protein